MKKIEYWWEETEQRHQPYPTIEVDDDATDEEIDKAVREAVFENFEWGYDEEARK